MGGLNFWSATTVDEAQTCNCTCISIRFPHVSTKRCITERAAHHVRNQRSVLSLRNRLIDSIFYLPRLQLSRKPLRNDVVKFLTRKTSHRSTKSTLICSSVLLHEDG